jgi:hypothetical protein
MSPAHSARKFGVQASACQSPHAPTADGKPAGYTIVLATSNGPNVFAQAASDISGRVWVTWQSMRGGLSDIYCRVFDSERDAWPPEIQVTKDPGGDWEPHLAFDDKDGARVLFDSSRGNKFNVN